MSRSQPRLTTPRRRRAAATMARRRRISGSFSRHPETGRYHSDRLIWGLIPHWVKEVGGGRRPINAKSETISSLPSFRAAYAKRRCIIPVDNFFEWRKKTPPKQPFAVGMKDGSPFGLAGIWENWRHPEPGEHIRTFCILTCPANDLIATIHDRMPVILPAEAYERWLSPIEPDPRDLLAPFPSGKCGCGRFPRGSTRRRTTTPVSSTRSNKGQCPDCVAEKTCKYLFVTG